MVSLMQLIAVTPEQSRECDRERSETLEERKWKWKCA
jgi:hypothetical protein